MFVLMHHGKEKRFRMSLAWTSRRDSYGIFVLMRCDFFRGIPYSYEEKRANSASKDPGDAREADVDFL